MTKLTDEQKQQIGELVGEATMQWSPTPTGTFKDVEATAIVNKIFAVLEQESTAPRVVFEFANKEDRDMWYGGYSNSGEQELYEYWYQDSLEVPTWKEWTEN